MKLGYTLRQTVTDSLRLVRDSINFFSYLSWLALDPAKFKKIKTNKIKSVLVIYSAATGDMINAIGLCNSLKKNYPNVSIYFLTEARNTRLFNTPHINVIDKIQAIELINAKKIDSAILLQGATTIKEIFDKNLFFKLLKVKYCVSCDYIQHKPSLLLKQIYPIPLTRKVYTISSNGFQDQLNAFRSLGFDIHSPEFYYIPKAEIFAKSFLKKYKITEKEPLIFMHAPAGTIANAKKEGKLPSHEWPAKNWAALADKLIKEFNARILFSGIEKEKPQIQEIITFIKNKKKTINLAGITNISETASLLKRGKVIVTIDTGTAHIAAQTGIKVIDLFGPVRPKDCSSLCDSIDIFHPEVCNGCRRYACPETDNICMKAITIEEIFNHVRGEII